METKNKFGKFFILLNQIPGADKEEIVWSHSGMFTTSLRDFYKNDPKAYNQMLDAMEHLANNAPKKPTEAEIKQWRSNILNRMQKSGIDTTDWQAVNSFLLNPRVAGKPIYNLTVPEMKALLPKLESIIQKEYKKKLEFNALQYN